MSPGMGMRGGATNHNKSRKTLKHMFFNMCSPRKETLTDAGDGEAGTILKTHKKNSETICFNIFYTILLFYLI